jgi:tetratricopeptide (TPR) repeat protein
MRPARRRAGLAAATLLAAFCALLAAMIPVAAAGAPAGASEAFLEGNRLYQEGDYPGAVKAYERILESGVTAPELEYNLANAYLKAGRTGAAVLHYRRALVLRSKFESAEQNLSYARSLTQDVKPDEGASAPRWGWVSRLRLGPALASGLLFAVFTAFAAVGVMRLRWWRERPAATVLQGVLGGLALLLAAALFFEWHLIEGRHEAVVVAKETEVRAGPGDQYTVSFRLHEGTEVEIVRASTGWREVRVSDRLQGWAPETAVTAIEDR